MIFQTVMDPTSLAETAFRAVRSSLTRTSTVTWAAGTPVVLATNTASNDGAYVALPATSTSIVNNLYAGNLHAAMPADTVGLVQVYGIDDDAIVQVKTDAQNPGAVLIPNSIPFLFSVSGPVTAAATSTSAHTEVPALGGFAYLLEAVASSSATATAATTVFIRAL